MPALLGRPAAYGGALEAHFGLGKRDSVDCAVTLPDGRRLDFPGLKTNVFLDANLSTRAVSEVTAR
ncbi:MAG: hypothetical protein RDV41_13155 [Planctomycetota bacterium]|nr:hypothetical protein [Planctomycetota bacterium]